MERNVINQLIGWKQKKNRKPLILNGARQVGKTYILQEFGKNFSSNDSRVETRLDGEQAALWCGSMVMKGNSRPHKH